MAAPDEVASELKRLREGFSKLHTSKMLTLKQQVQLAIINSVGLSLTSLASGSHREELLRSSRLLAEEFLDQDKVKP